MLHAGCALAVLYFLVSFPRVAYGTLATNLNTATKDSVVVGFLPLVARDTFYGSTGINDGNFDVNPETAPSIFGLSILQFGTTLGGLALIVLGLLIWLCHRSKRRRVTDHEAAGFLDHKYMATTTAPPAPPPPVPSLARPERSFSMLKREQTEAIPRYGDTQTLPDVLIPTARGLQLMPAPLPPKKKRTAFWRKSTASSRSK
ncbi:hypothetical protein C8R46DRAFT_349194 [Mycena filopes]|nr:hypothetical protein C8R46DRAFT_349194 [Mycena filopes]